MTLIKTSLLNGIAVAVKMITMLGINKILAVYVGPSGYAAIGQFQNAMQMITTFASGAINTGVTKYTAEHYDDEQKQHDLWKTAGSITIAGSLFSAVIIIIFNQQLALWFLKDKHFGGVFVWFACSLVFFTLNTLLLAILNGKKAILTYVIANSVGSLLALVFTSIMTMRMGLYGALVALAVYQSISFICTLVLCLRSHWFKISFIFGKIDRATAINLGKYTGMALTSAACIPLSQILVRNHVGTTLGWNYAGYWEAMWRLSAAYLMLVTTTLSVYYLPRLSEIKSSQELRNEIIKGYKIILPVALVSGSMIYLLRDLIIGILFTHKFSEMSQLFGWEIAGDTLKIGSWILSYVMLGKAMVKLFILTEILFTVSYIGLCWFFIYEMGFVGVAVAFTINYAAYWAIMWRYIMKRKSQK